MIIRRPFDTTAVTILRVIFLVVSVVGLGAFAVDRIVRVTKQEYYAQTRTVNLLNQTKYEADIVICADKAIVYYDNTTMNVIAKDLKHPSIPPGYIVPSPCFPEHNAMFIIWYKERSRTIRHTSDLTTLIELKTNTTTDVAVIAMTRAHNVYGNTGLILEKDAKNFNFNVYNTHFVRPGETTSIFVHPRVLRTLRRDWLGLFRVYNETKETGLTSTIETISTPGRTMFRVKTPISWQEDEEVLFLDIPGAVATWGGVFSLVVSIFYMLFGSGRLSPFGVVQTYLVHSSTKKRLRDAYPQRNEDGVDFNTQGTDHHEQSRHLNVPNEKTRLGDGHTIVSLDEQDHSQNDVYSRSFTSTEHPPQQHQEELALLRAFVYGEILPRLQRQEQRSEDRESLMRHMYLDMEMVDVALEESRTSAPGYTAQTVNWIKRMMKRGKVSNGH
ncbi:MAG: hypothetical protein J3Q66DRAFT_12370 [Benniella sp.]|nr:MAG: hypothetical protein J3Q66DRAFT_12370 [Benniella sp.]